ncbi:hypothetical protein [Candidatus Neptunichlamydia sp. REUL1]|uniref:hypothetical protein n=1 Tax=Candidatus Neptunichlamydia sp. REUL1 TaxID=3064277 RepID=UPI00293012D2|nr:hypothetical protein [Candidatus Neptunochlamydia sp. REUL1]
MWNRRTFQGALPTTNLSHFSYTIELKKFFEDIGSKIQSALDLWSAFLLRNDLLSKAKLPASLDDAPVKKAINVLNVMDFSEEEREIYEGKLKWLRIEANTLKKYEEKGIEKVALALLQQGLAPAQIPKATGLSEEKTLILETK